MGLASIERAQLADLFDEVGPDAPTLCEGWATRDLAAHLVLREGRPDAGVGIVVKPLAGWTQHVQHGLADGDWTALVERVRTGPPWWSMYRLPGLEEPLNSFEFLVHHEDVRRAQPDWEPRDLPDKAVDAIWARLVKGGGKLFFRRAQTGVTLRRPDGQESVARAGEPMVTLVGHPVELVLYAFGRRDHAHVTLEGDEAAVAAFRATRLGV